MLFLTINSNGILRHSYGMLKGKKITHQAFHTSALDIVSLPHGMHIKLQRIKYFCFLIYRNPTGVVRSLPSLNFSVEQSQYNI